LGSSARTHGQDAFGVAAIRLAAKGSRKESTCSFWSRNATLFGHGGVRVVARVAGVSETTVRKGVFELEQGDGPLPIGRVRRAGGGRRSVVELDPALLSALLALVEPDERGDPMSPLRWTTKSLRHLAGELTR